MKSTSAKHLLAVASVAVILLSGCAGGSPSQLRLHLPGAQIPTYAQGDDVLDVQPFRIRITRAFWTDRFEKPGYASLANLPDSFRQLQEAQFIAKPTAKFLVIEFSVTNTGQQATTWRTDQPPVFMLVNAQGIEYASVGQDVNADDLTAKVILGQASINPGMTIAGKKVFDVPPGEYLMHVSFGRHVGGFSFVKGSTAFKWALKPTGL